MNKKVLVVEISGKRPGGKKERPTENFELDYPHIIISNNADGYETDWPIVMVPEDYQSWYKEHFKSSDNAWYAPMNRSYAIKYAREHGYDYVVQLDDNIKFLQVAYIIKEIDDDGIVYAKTYRNARGEKKFGDMPNDFIAMLIAMLENTNAGIAGFNLSGAAVPGCELFCERYVYSFFALKLGVIPDCYQGDFEDDIDFRLKLAQMGIPSIQCQCMGYGKVSQKQLGDTTGCRKAYVEAGVKRGEHMRKLYGELYSAGLSYKSAVAGRRKQEQGKQYFKHKLKPFKVGILVKDRKAMDDEITRILAKYAKRSGDKIKLEGWA